MVHLVVAMANTHLQFFVPMSPAEFQNLPRVNHQIELLSHFGATIADCYANRERSRFRSTGSRSGWQTRGVGDVCEELHLTGLEFLVEGLAFVSPLKIAPAIGALDAVIASEQRRAPELFATVKPAFDVEDDQAMPSYVAFLKCLHSALSEAASSGKGLLFIQLFE